MKKWHMAFYGTEGCRFESCAARYTSHFMVDASACVFLFRFVTKCYFSQVRPEVRPLSA